mgnify:CR=1 FL=1
MPDTNMRPFEVGDGVQWMRARGQPLGTVLKPSEPEVGFEGPACFVQLDTGYAMWLSDAVLTLIVAIDEAKRQEVANA